MTKAEESFIEVYNAIQTLFEKGYLTKEEYNEKIDTLCHTVISVLAYKKNKIEKENIMQVYV